MALKPISFTFFARSTLRLAFKEMVHLFGPAPPLAAVKEQGSA
jgi:hypothetical protein